MKKRLKMKKEKEQIVFSLFDHKPKNWKQFKEACRESQKSDDWLRIQYPADYHSITGSADLDVLFDLV